MKATQKTEFRTQGTMLEKQDVVRRGREVSSRIRYGYRSNKAGVGWTNAVFITLFDDLPPAMRERFADSEHWRR